GFWLSLAARSSCRAGGRPLPNRCRALASSRATWSARPRVSPQVTSSEVNTPAAGRGRRKRPSLAPPSPAWAARARPAGAGAPGGGWPGSNGAADGADQRARLEQALGILAIGGRIRDDAAPAAQPHPPRTEFEGADRDIQLQACYRAAIPHSTGVDL